MELGSFKTRPEDEAAFKGRANLKLQKSMHVGFSDGFAWKGVRNGAVAFRFAHRVWKISKTGPVQVTGGSSIERPCSVGQR